jgi:PAS domain S-box-containing protein
LWGAIFEHASWGIRIGSGDGSRVLAVNPTFAAMHEYTVGELSQRPIQDLYPPEHASEALVLLGRVAQHGRQVYESVHRRRDGSRFPVLVDATMISGPDETNWYLARDLRHDRFVALKVILPELGIVLGPECFLSEIRVTAHLQHPNLLLPLFDSGEAAGLLYFVVCPPTVSASLDYRPPIREMGVTALTVSFTYPGNPVPGGFSTRPSCRMMDSRAES